MAVFTNTPVLVSRDLGRMRSTINRVWYLLIFRLGPTEMRLVGIPLEAHTA